MTHPNPVVFIRRGPLKDPGKPHRVELLLRAFEPGFFIAWDGKRILKFHQHQILSDWSALTGDTDEQKSFQL